MQKLRISLLLPAALLVACGTPQAEEATITIALSGATAIPVDGECAHITATRIADFAVSEYRGTLAAATFQAQLGEHRLFAVAYPAPCETPPSPVPWVSDEQAVTFSRGQNTVVMNFRANVQVGVDVNFEDPDATGIAVRPGSLRQIGRNGEDITAGVFTLDGWTVKSLELGTGSEVPLFSTQGAGFSGTPRGLAILSDGRFVLQDAFATNPLRTFSGAGSALAAWPVSYPAGTTLPNAVDGLEAEDDTHFLRTAYLAPPICDGTGTCLYSMVERLELRPDGLGGSYLEVVDQMTLPVLPGHSLHEEYAVAVTPLVDSGFAVATIDNALVPGVHLTLFNSDGSLRAGPAYVSGSIEGLVDDGARLIAVGYSGQLRTFNRMTLAENVSEARDLSIGVDFPVPVALAWRSANNTFLAVNSEPRVVAANDTFDSIATIPVDLTGFIQPYGLAYKSDSDELAIADRVPPFDPVSNVRVPAVSLFNPNTGAPTGIIRFQGMPYTGLLRVRSIAYIALRKQFVVHYRKAQFPNDPVNTQLYFYDLDGTQVAVVDLAPHGFTYVSSVNFVPGTNQVLVLAVDGVGAQRLVRLNAAGVPVGSITVPASSPVVDLAPITSGPFIGDLGFINGQPSLFWRGTLP